MTGPSPPRQKWTPRLARQQDIPVLDQLIPLSVRELQAPWYNESQREASIGPVFAVDRQLIQDGTFFVVEHDGQIVGCGGWSRRKKLCGGETGDGLDALLDPIHNPAGIRAFFVHPAWARQGIGTSILGACEAAIRAAGFSSAQLVATLAGEPLYASHGYAAVERFDLPMSDGLSLPVVRMSKRLFTEKTMHRQNIPANTPWEESLCYSRAVRVGQFIAVSQTSAVDEQGKIVGCDDPYAQAVRALENIRTALRAAGGELRDVVRSRIYLARFDNLAAVAKAHAECFRNIRPAVSIQTCTMISPEILVEFEVDAIKQDEQS